MCCQVKCLFVVTKYHMFKNFNIINTFVVLSILFPFLTFLFTRNQKRDKLPFFAKTSNLYTMTTKCIKDFNVKPINAIEVRLLKQIILQYLLY